MKDVVDWGWFADVSVSDLVQNGELTDDGHWAAFGLIIGLVLGVYLARAL